MKTKRLELLIEILENVPRRKFTLHTWMAPYSQLDSDDPAFKKGENGEEYWLEGIRKAFEKKPLRKGSDIEKAIPLDCKTAGCAMGWAASDPRFNRIGLYLEDRFGAPAPAFYDKKTNDISEDDGDIAHRIFGIERRTYEHLFYGTWYARPHPTPKDVIKKIRSLIKLGEEKFVQKDNNDYWKRIIQN